MKKKIILTLAVLVAISLGVVGMSAFEAHVINVTAQIENALTVPLEASGMSFGTVFPEEVALQNMGIQLSSSFLTTDRVDDIEYMIRQKPKCGVPIPNTNPVEYSSFVQVTENADGIFSCPMVTVQGQTAPEQVQSVMLPLLCPYLSKHELDANGATTTNGIAAFHGPLTGWTMDDTLKSQVGGRLSKADLKTSTTWQIDLHAPCFRGMCAQDNVIPAAYEADPAYEHQMFGCDLWIEVGGVSLNGPGTLTVTKIVVGGDKTVANFPLFVDGMSVTSGVATTTSAGSHTVSETPDQLYTAAFSGNCNSNGVVNVPASGSAACTITNTFNGVPPGELTVTKIVSGGTKTAAEFPLFVDGMSVTTGVATTTSAGSHTVTETIDPNYTESFGTDCPGGIVSVPTGGNATCTITNTIKDGNLTVIKEVVGGQDLPSAFTINVSNGTPSSFAGNSSGTSVVVPVNGSYLVTENPLQSNYDVTYSTDCTGTMTLTGKTCTVTNTRKIGNITVHKVVIKHIDGTTTEPGNFQMKIDDSNVAQDTSLPYPTGSHIVSEVSNPNYTVSFSADCPGGVVNVTKDSSTTCTVTNEQKYGILTVIKQMSNTHGGNNVTGDFSLLVVGPSGFIGVSNGVPKNFAVPGSYDMTETGPDGYQAVFSGDCDINGHINLVAGDNKTCTITNYDIAPIIKLVKNVVGTPAEFTLKIDGTVVPNGFSYVTTSNSTHTITEDAKPGYTFTSMTGAGSQGSLCPSTLGGTVTLNEGETITCTITNTADIL